MSDVHYVRDNNHVPTPQKSKDLFNISEKPVEEQKGDSSNLSPNRDAIFQFRGAAKQTSNYEVNMNMSPPFVKQQK